MTRPAASDERGFTLIEVLVAMVLSLMVVFAIIATMDKSGATSVAQQRDTQAVSIGEQEIEKVRTLVRQYGFASLQLSSLPTAVSTSETNPSDPNAFVSGSSFRILSSWHDTASLPIDVAHPSEPLLVSAGTAGGADRLAPGPQTIQLGSPGDSGTHTVTINRYVTRRSDPSCPPGNVECQDDSRRVVFAIRISRGGSPISRVTPIYVSTVINRGVPSNTANGTGGLAIGVNLP